MRIFVAEVYRLAAYAADGLGLEDLEAGIFKCPPGTFLSIGSRHNMGGAF